MSWEGYSFVLNLKNGNTLSGKNLVLAGDTLRYNLGRRSRSVPAQDATSFMIHKPSVGPFFGLLLGSGAVLGLGIYKINQAANKGIGDIDTLLGGMALSVIGGVTFVGGAIILNGNERENRKYYRLE